MDVGIRMYNTENVQDLCAVLLFYISAFTPYNIIDMIHRYIDIYIHDKYIYIYIYIYIDMIYIYIYIYRYR